MSDYQDVNDLLYHAVTKLADADRAIRDANKMINIMKNEKDSLYIVMINWAIAGKYIDPTTENINWIGGVYNYLVDARKAVSDITRWMQQPSHFPIGYYFTKDWLKIVAYQEKGTSDTSMSGYLHVFSMKEKDKTETKTRYSLSDLAKPDPDEKPKGSWINQFADT